MIAEGDDWGSAWPVFQYKDRTEEADRRRQKKAELAARKCACGNFKTPGKADGLCNSCRGAAVAVESTSKPASATRAGQTTSTFATERKKGIKRPRAGSDDEAASSEHDIKEGGTPFECPTCGKDLLRLGAYRRERHLEKCGGG